MMNEAENDPPYPEARRTYRLLGVVHGILFGAIGFSSGLGTSIWWAIGGGVAFGLVGLGVFWYLANEHYRGDVPGKPGSLEYMGENDE